MTNYKRFIINAYKRRMVCSCEVKIKPTMRFRLDYLGVLHPGDYDGNGKSDAAVFRPSNDTWYVQGLTSGTMIQTFGQIGDVPIPNVFVP